MWNMLWLEFSRAMYQRGWATSHSWLDFVMNSNPRIIFGICKNRVSTFTAILGNGHCPGPLFSTDRVVDKMWDTKAPSCASSPADKHAMKSYQPGCMLAFPPWYVITFVRRPLQFPLFSPEVSSSSGVHNTSNPCTHFAFPSSRKCSYLLNHND